MLKVNRQTVLEAPAAGGDPSCPVRDWPSHPSPSVHGGALNALIQLFSIVGLGFN